MTRIIIVGRNDAIQARPFSNHLHLVSGSQPDSAACRTHALPGGEPSSPASRPFKGVSGPTDQPHEAVTPEAAGRHPFTPAADWSELFVLFASAVAFAVGFGLMWSVR